MSRRSTESMRRLYDWFQHFYGFFEWSIGSGLEACLAAFEGDGPTLRADSVLEHCCGSASLGLRLAPRCATYEGRDQSAGMLARARRRWVKAFGAATPPPFRQENVLEFDAAAASVDWVAISFALHLFSPATTRDLLARFLAAARKGVLVFEHEVKDSALMAAVEALEGSWYDEYLKADFARVADELGATFSDRVVKGVRLMVFEKRPA